MHGTILDVPVEVGDAVSAVTTVTGGTLLLVIADPEPLHLKGSRRRERGRARRRRPAGAAPDRGLSGADLRGRGAAHRAARRSASRTSTYFEVEVLVTDPDAHLLRPLMSADADIVTETVADAPGRAGGRARLRGRPGAGRARRPRASAPTLERRPVTVGIVASNRAQILAGIDAGDEVRLR